MKDASQLPFEVMVEIISEIQAILWQDVHTDGDAWNADKEWDSETLEYVAAVLEDHGLRPPSAPREAHLDG